MLKFIILLFYIFVIGCSSNDKIGESLSDEGDGEETLDVCIMDYYQSSRVSYYVFPYVKLNDKNLESNDWVAAFNGDVCVGARLWDTSNCNNEVCDVPAMGVDSFTPSLTQDYCESGDVPTFKIYDESEDKIYDARVKNLSDIFIDVNAWKNNDIFIVTDTLIAILETGMDCSD